MRVLAPALEAYLDEKITLAADLTEAQLLVAAASACVGIAESGGDNRGPLVELIQSTIAKPAGQSWCADFLQTCVAYVEKKKSILSTLPATQGVLDLWNRAKDSHAVQRPQAGDLIVWRFGSTIQGHCGMITGVDTLLYSTIEGNTSDAQGIEREGDGVFAKKRAKGGTKTFVELGFLRVFNP